MNKTINQQFRSVVIEVVRKIYIVICITGKADLKIVKSSVVF